RTDGELGREAAVAKRALRAEARQAEGAIARLVRAARKGVVAADKSTRGDIAAAAQSGLGFIDSARTSAVAELAAEEGKAEDAATRQASAERSAIDTTATGDARDLRALADAVGAKIDSQWVDEAVAAAGKDLDDEGLFNIVTDAEALHALDLLISLPPGLQGKAIAKLPDDRFENLLDEVPRLRRNDFESLVKNTTDPKRKLLLWREYYKAHATVDAESRKGDVGEEVFSGGTKPTAAQAENRRREDHRRAAAEDSQHEADEE